MHSPDIPLRPRAPRRSRGFAFLLLSSCSLLTNLGVVPMSAQGTRCYPEWTVLEPGLLPSSGSLAVDANNHILVAGFRGDIIGTVSGLEGVTLKIAPNGQVLWRAVLINGAGRVGVRQVTVDQPGNAYVVGSFYGTDEESLVVVSYDPSGVERWRSTYRDPGSTSTRGSAVCVGTAGMVYASGLASIGNNAGSNEVVTVALAASDGRRLWTDRHTGKAVAGWWNGADSVMLADSVGNVHVSSGMFWRPGSFDITGFVLKYTTNGTFQWRADQQPTSFRKTLGIDRSGRILVSGYQPAGAGLVQLDTDGHTIWSHAPRAWGSTLGTQDQITAALETQVVQFDADHTPVWTNTHGLLQTFGMACNALGDVALTGYVNPTAPQHPRTEIYDHHGLPLRYVLDTDGHGWNEAVAADRQNSFIVLQNMQPSSIIQKITGNYISLALEVDTALTSPGSVLTYTLRVGAGEKPQTRVQVTVPLPPGTTRVQGGTPGADGTVGWLIPRLEALAVTTLAFSVRLGLDTSSTESVECQGVASSTELTEPRLSNLVSTDVYRPWSDAALDTPQLGDPVQAGPGSYVFRRTLCTLYSSVLPVCMELRYESRAHSEHGPCGYGWTHSYDSRVTAEGDTAEVRWGDGTLDLFRMNSTGAYEPVTPHTRATLQQWGGNWTAALPNGTSYSFTVDGCLQSIQDPNSYQLTFTSAYVESRREIKELRDTGNRRIQFAYLDGHLASLTVPSAGQVLFEYDAQTNLVALTDLRGSRWTFGYDSEHRLLTVTGPLGKRLVANAYDTRGRLISQTNALNQVTTWRRDSSGSSGTLRVDIVAPGGRTATHYYDGSSRLAQLVDPMGGQASFTYDPAGRRTSATDKNRAQATFAYDAHGNPTSIVDRAGSPLRLTFGDKGRPTERRDAAGGISTLRYDAYGNLTQMTDARGASITFTYGNMGIPSRTTDANGNSWNTSYHLTHRPIAATDPLGNTVQCTVDALGRLASITRPNTSERAQFSYDSNGHLTNATDYLGFVTWYAYDAEDRLVARTFVPQGAVTRYEYDDLGQLTACVDALGSRSTYHYDAGGRLVRTQDADGVVELIAYNLRSQITARTNAAGQVIRYEYDLNGNLVRLDHGSGSTWQRAYDSEQRLIESTDPQGDRLRFSHDVLGHLIAVTTETGRVTRMEYDAVGCLVSRVAPDGSRTRYQRNVQGNVTNILDALGRSWTFAFDARNRLSRQTNPRGETVAYEYDPQGHLTRVTGPGDRVLTHTYDANGRETQSTLPGDPEPVLYTHDPAGNLTEVAHSSGTTRMTYDLLGRRTLLTDVFGNSLAYQYSPAGRLRAVVYPENRTVEYSYDAAGRIERVHDWAGRDTLLSYDAFGRLARVLFPNGTQTLYSYDSSHRIARLHHERNDGSMLLDYQYAYDAEGRLARRSKETAGVLALPPRAQVTAVYDEANRLQTLTAENGLIQHIYDDRGNLVRKDDRGHLSLYVYDAMNRLLSSSNGTRVVTYRYDGLGRRVSRATSLGTETRYLVDQGRLYATFDGANSVQALHIHGSLLLYTVDASGQIQVYHADERGTVEAVTGPRGQLLRSASYDPYGQCLASSGNAGAEFGYLGTHDVLSEDDGLCFAGARWYDPAQGRFLSEDPLGTSAGPNRYAYADGDPLNSIDPSGLAASRSGAFSPMSGAPLPSSLDFASNSHTGNKASQAKWKRSISFSDTLDAPAPQNRQLIQHHLRSQQAATSPNHPSTRSDDLLVLDSSPPEQGPRELCYQLIYAYGNDPALVMGQIITARGGDKNSPVSPEVQAQALAELEQKLGVRLDSNMLRDMDHWVNSYICLQGIAAPQSDDWWVTQTAKTTGRTLLMVPAMIGTVGYSGAKAVAAACPQIDLIGLVTGGEHPSSGKNTSAPSVHEVIVSFDGIVYGVFDTNPSAP